MLSFLLYLVIAGLAGTVGARLAGRGGLGCLGSIAAGLIGALLGSWLEARLGLPEPLMLRPGGRPFPLLWSIVGAALFVALLNLISFRRLRA